MSKVVTRFAPSPTGFLHIGGGRTALFNWLFARHHGGTFLLRIEDTDRARSTQEAVDALIDGLDWLGLNWDGETVFQFARMDRHAEVAHQMVADGRAYYCYCTPEELDDMRKDQVAKGKPQQYDGRCRHRTSPRDGVKPVVRIKAPRPAVASDNPDGDDDNMLIHDIVHGDIWVPYAQLDDMILLRSDGTPTYMLSVVVDDHDMGITHVIRGDDHITNAFRQRMIYDAMGWDVPAFVHIPLIHGPDGAKLSKRHGAVGLEAYRDMGYLPEAMRNYLLRLGWGHGDTDIISTEDAIKIFRLEDIGKSPSRMDFTKLAHVNAHYMRSTDEDKLMDMTIPFIEKELGHAADATGIARFAAGLGGLKERASTLVELAQGGMFYLRPRPLPLDDKAKETLDDDARAALRDMEPVLGALDDFSTAAIETALKSFAADKGLKLGKVAMPLRCALTGSTNSPSVFHVAEILGKEETLARIGDAR